MELVMEAAAREVASVAVSEGGAGTARGGVVSSGACSLSDESGIRYEELGLRAAAATGAERGA
eukprot:COSAG04_NODE_2153_length_4678_cov_5.860668_1_plen_62_part_10